MRPFHEQLPSYNCCMLASDVDETPSVVTPDAHLAADATVTASRALLGIIARSLAPALEKVTLPQFRVLVVLSTSGALRMGALAELLGVNISTFSRAADRLVTGGWAARTENPLSRREILLELTDQGRILVEAVTGHRRRLIAHVLNGMSASDRAALARSLDAFADAAGEPQIADLLVLGI